MFEWKTDKWNHIMQSNNKIILWKNKFNLFHQKVNDERKCPFQIFKNGNIFYLMFSFKNPQKNTKPQIIEKRWKKKKCIRKKIVEIKETWKIIVKKIYINFDEWESSSRTFANKKKGTRLEDLCEQSKKKRSLRWKFKNKRKITNPSHPLFFHPSFEHQSCVRLLSSCDNSKRKKKYSNK